MTNSKRAAVSHALGGILLLTYSAAAAQVEVWYNITYSTANPDGLAERTVVGVNGTWPLPPIEIMQNDTLLVHATNGLGDTNTAVHHHGMFFNSTSFYDGAVGVTQCGIPPGQSFSYLVDAQANNQYGTYWYHSHYQGQYADGMRAPLIIHKEQEAYQYDEEFTVTLHDWYHEEHRILMETFASEANPTGAEPVPKSALMYFSQNSAYLPGFSENATLAFQPGKTYRLRLINMSSLAMFAFYIDGHDMSVIEVEGTDVEQYPIDQVTLSVAQRVSVLVTARNDTSSNYLIHANMNPQMFDTVPDDLQLNITSTISYGSGNPVAESTTLDEYIEFPDQQMVPLETVAELDADVFYDLGIVFETADNGINRAFINNITYQMPVVPTYLTAVSMGNDSFIPSVYGQTNTYVVQHGHTVQLTITNWDGNPHPVHFHGHKFQLVSESYDVSSDDRTLNPLVPEGLANPMRRDTITLPGDGGSRTVRFRADNPGAWFFHCHIDWHLESGFAAVFVVAPDVMAEYVGAPTTVVEQCQALGFATSGNAAGWNSTDDFRGLTIGPYPQVLGWHPKGIGALAGCIITALLGIATVIWYALGGALDEDELHYEVAEAVARKQAKGSKLTQARRLFAGAPRIQT